MTISIFFQLLKVITLSSHIRNWAFDTNSNFLIHMTLQPNLRNSGLDNLRLWQRLISSAPLHWLKELNWEKIFWFWSHPFRWRKTSLYVLYNFLYLIVLHTPIFSQYPTDVQTRNSRESIIKRNCGLWYLRRF